MKTPRAFDIHRDPLEHFIEFYDEARTLANKSGLQSFEANVMCLATSVFSAAGPSHSNAKAESRDEIEVNARMVLFKDLYKGGFTFFTNYESAKGSELLKNPRVAAVFYWHNIYKQVRIQGVVHRLPDAESDAYFKTRARLSQLGAWASHQSQFISSYAQLEEQLEQVRVQYENQEVPRPPHWGGYVLMPEKIEFWLGREGRLHERYQYLRFDNGWQVKMLSP